jgi:uncharacterized tellurite resistance protein B-like protein
MINFFKKKEKPEEKIDIFEIELTASVLAYEIARSDGEITSKEQTLLLDEINKITLKTGKDQHQILNMIEVFSTNSISFHEFIEDINKFFSKEEKLSLLKFLWDIAYADSLLDINEERLIRRIANLINIKDIQVLRLKDVSKNNKNF